MSLFRLLHRGVFKSETHVVQSSTSANLLKVLHCFSIDWYSMIMLFGRSVFIILKGSIGVVSDLLNPKRHQLKGPQVLLRSHTSKAPLKGLKGH